MNRLRFQHLLSALVLSGAAHVAAAQDQPKPAPALRECAVVSAGAGDRFAEQGVNKVQSIVDRQILDSLMQDLRQNGYAVEPTFVDFSDSAATSTVVEALQRTRCAGLIQIVHHMGEDAEGRYFSFDVQVMHAVLTGASEAGKGTPAKLAGDFERKYRFPRTQEGMEAFHTGTFANTVFADLTASHSIDKWYDPDPDAAVVRNEYDRIAAQFNQPEFHVRHILVADEAKARDAIARIRSGESFEVVARQVSTDTGSSRNGGDLGWSKPAYFVPEFSRAMVALAPKGFDAEPVRTQFGWHVIEVLEQRPGQFPSFDSVKVKVAAKMKLVHDQALQSQAH